MQALHSINNIIEYYYSLFNLFLINNITVVMGVLEPSCIFNYNYKHNNGAGFALARIPSHTIRHIYLQESGYLKPNYLLQEQQ